MTTGLRPPSCGNSRVRCNPTIAGLLRMVQGFDRLAKHAEEWPAAPCEDLYASVNVYGGSNWSSNASNAVTNSTTLGVTPNVTADTCGCPDARSTALVN